MPLLSLRLCVPLLALGPYSVGSLLVSTTGPGLEVVIASHSGHFQWGNLLREVGHQVKTYCIGPVSSDSRCERVTVPNSTTPVSANSTEAWMLQHILLNYNRLPDVTLFAHDAPAAEAAAQRLLTELDTPEKRRHFGGFTASDYQPISWDLKLPRHTCRASANPFGVWYNWYINTTDTRRDHLACTASSADSVFAVSRERVQLVPRWRYKEMLMEVRRCGASDNAAGHFMMRSWVPLFSQECHDVEDQRAKSRSLSQVSAPTLFGDRSLDLVVATYKAPLDWIDPLLQRLPTARLHLYCKGNHSRDPRCIPLENVGTEEYAYFKHILRNWDNLADITIFTIDNILENAAGYTPTTQDCLDYVASTVDTRGERLAFSGFEALEFEVVTEHFDISRYYSSSLAGDGLEKKTLCNASYHPLGSWYLHFLNPWDTNFTRLACTGASMHGIFAVSREAVRTHPKSTFKDLVKEVERCRGQNQFVAGHYMERSWAPLFSKQCHYEEAWANLRRRNQRQHLVEQLQGAFR